MTAIIRRWTRSVWVDASLDQAEADEWDWDNWSIKQKVRLVVWCARYRFWLGVAAMLGKRWE